MLIGILSDTHDQVARTLTAVRMLTDAGAEVLIHCGDLTGPEIVYACGGVPCYFVFGNNEDDLGSLRRAMADIDGVCLEWAGEVTLGGKRIAVTHGHLARDVRRLLLARPDYFLFGHSHTASDERQDGIRRINPGALYRAEQYSVAVLDLDSDMLQFLTVPR
jgi:hypothetical protein